MIASISINLIKTRQVTLRNHCCSAGCNNACNVECGVTYSVTLSVTYSVTYNVTYSVTYSVTVKVVFIVKGNVKCHTLLGVTSGFQCSNLFRVTIYGRMKGSPI